MKFVKRGCNQLLYGQKYNHQIKYDPTTFSATLHKMKSDSNSSKKSIKCISNKSIDITLQTPTNTAKVLSDVDVTDWDKDVKKTKVVLIPDSNRVWGSAPVENEIEIPVSSGMQRSIDFSGKFEPVSWTCRAPLPSGRL